MRAVVLLLLVAGCKDPPVATTVDAPRIVSAPDARVAAAVEPGKPDATIQVDTTPPPAPGSGKLGVATCDEYLDKMARCIAHLSADAQGPMREGLEDSRKAWQASAATPEGRKALAPTCKQALDVAKSAAAAMGCEW